MKTFHANGKAIVRNVTLPAEYAHVIVPATRDLAASPAMRAWIDAYVPDYASDKPGAGAAARRAERQRHLGRRRLVQLKKHWALEAQRFVRARRGAAAGRSAQRAPGRGGTPLEVKFACRGPGRHGRRAIPRAAPDSRRRP